MGELAVICAAEGEHTRASELFGEALRRDPGDLESLYGRGLSAIEVGNYQAAVEDGKAVEVYGQILDRTPVSEAYYGLGRLLAKQGKTNEARQTLQEILAKQVGLPRYLRRQERPWVWKARMLLKKLLESA